MQLKHLIATIASALPLVCGCGHVIDSPLRLLPELAPVAPRYEDAQSAGLEAAVSQDSLDLSTAVRLAESRNPGLRSATWDIATARARLLQADVRLNPELELEIEEFGGSGDLAGSGSLASAVVFNQEIEAGRKRSKRRRVAQIEIETATLDAEIERTVLAAEVAKAFWEVFAAQERLQLAKDLTELSSRFLEAVKSKRDAGRATALEHVKGEVSHSASVLELARATRSLNTSRRELAAFWGSEQPLFSRVAGRFYDTPEPPDLNALLSTTDANAAVALGRANTAAAQAALDLERASETPNFSVGIGVQHFEESGDSAFIMSLGMPLMIFDKNRGGVLAARASLEQSHEDARAVELDTRMSMRRAHAGLLSASEDALNLRDVILPAAQRGFDAAQEGYNQGRYGYLEVLDARRTLFEGKAEYIESVVSCWLASAEVERLSSDIRPDSSFATKRLTGGE